jgi:hypothetical protein
MIAKVRFKQMAKISVSHLPKGNADIILLCRYEPAVFPSFCRSRQSSPPICLRWGFSIFDNGFSKLSLFCSVFREHCPAGYLDSPRGS